MKASSNFVAFFLGSKSSGSKISMFRPLESEIDTLKLVEPKEPIEPKEAVSHHLGEKLLFSNSVRRNNPTSDCIDKKLLSSHRVPQMNPVLNGMA